MFTLCSVPIPGARVVNGRYKVLDSQTENGTQQSSTLASRSIQAVAECDPGHTLDRAEMRRLLCTKGHWASSDDPAPSPLLEEVRCSRSRHCDPNPTVDNSILLLSDEVRGEARLSCRPGLRFQRPAPGLAKVDLPWDSFGIVVDRETILDELTLPLTCSTSGDWVVVIPAGPEAGEEMPVICAPIACGPPPQIEHGQVEYSSDSVGSMARYSCVKPYILRGLSQRRCLSSGKWSSDPIVEPNCRRIGLN